MKSGNGWIDWEKSNEVASAGMVSSARGESPMVALLRMPRKSVDQAHFDRRVFPRKETSMTIAGKRIDHSLPALRHPSVTLSLRDVSAGGLSAISPTPLERGERLSVQFPAHGNRGGWDASGRVIRCEPSAFGYRVALEFDAMSTAA
jgi:hypothetical protein